MADAAQTSAQQIVPLTVFVQLRRPHEKKSSAQWIRDVKADKIPGAFQWNGRGRWFVNLDVYDAEVQKLSAPKTTAPDDSLQMLADQLGLSATDLKTVRRAAGI